jgi:hypothetical protein
MSDLSVVTPIDPADRFGVATPGVALPPADRAPTATAPRRRRPWLWPLVAVLVVALAGGGYLVGRLTAPSRGPLVVGVAQGLAAGTPITADELRLVHVSTAPTGALRSVSAAVGQTALRTVPVGSVLTTGDLGPAAAYPTTGRTLVGVDVKPGQAPAEGLQPGDVVAAVEQPQSQNGRTRPPVVLVGAAVVTAVHQTSDGEAVTLDVPTAVSVPLAAQAAGGTVALVRVPGH